MEKYPLIRKIYLYLFSMVGLILMIIAGISFINMALKAYVFTKADDMLRIEYKQPPYAPVAVEKLEQARLDATSGKQVVLTENQIGEINNWLNDYKNWQEQREKLDPVLVNRQQDAATNLAMIIVGLPLYLYHWSVIRREMRKKEESSDTIA